MGSAAASADYPAGIERNADITVLSESTPVTEEVVMERCVVDLEWKADLSGLATPVVRAEHGCLSEGLLFLSQPMAVAVRQVGVTAAAEVAAGDGGNGSEGSVAKPVATAVSKAAALTTVPMAKLTAVAVTTELTVKMTVVLVVATETVA